MQFVGQKEPYESREKLSQALVQFHNEVNERLGKKQVPYAEIRAKYLQCLAGAGASGKCQLIGLAPPVTTTAVAGPVPTHLWLWISIPLLILVLLCLFIAQKPPIFRIRATAGL
jgi:hypothetical protein